MQFRYFAFLLGSFLVLLSCSSQSEHKTENNFTAQANSQPVSHQPFSLLLQKYVAITGRVNYPGLIQDSVKLNEYLSSLSQNPPGSDWSRNEKLAYWINAYNGFTLQLILRYYPVKSIKDIGSKVQIPFVNTVWDIDFIRIGEKQTNLNEIEHQILRKQFAEPRIHFAIVCASVSCPKLRNEAYNADNLEQQLHNQAQTFINDSSRNILRPDEIHISKIFSWFKGDFTRTGSLINFLNQYSSVKINPDARVSTLDYNWNLNE